MKKKIDWKAEIFDFVKTLVICFIIVFAVTTFIVKPARVSQNSMYPTIYDKSIGIGNVIGVKLGNIDRFDIVVINTKRSENTYIIKRVIGLPGETVEFKNSQLFINGEVVEESFLDQNYYDEITNIYGYFTEDIPPIVLGEGEIFCLGDNRRYSKDSRHYGPFEISQVVSKDFFVVYPFGKFGGVK